MLSPLSPLSFRPSSVFHRTPPPSAPGVTFGSDESLLPPGHSDFQTLDTTLPGLQESVSRGYANRLSKPLAHYTGPTGPHAGLSVMEWPAVQAAPQSKALETGSMLGCAAFTIQEPPDATFTFTPPFSAKPLTLEPRHLMGHLNSPTALVWTPQMLHNLLDALAAKSNRRPWNLERCRFTLMPGILPDTLDTVRTIQTVLHQRSLLARAEYVHYPVDAVEALNWQAIRPAKPEHGLPPEIVLAHTLSLISHNGQHFWRRTPKHEDAFTPSAHMLHRIDFSPEHHPAVTVEVHSEPEEEMDAIIEPEADADSDPPRFGSRHSSPFRPVSHRLGILGNTGINSLLASTHPKPVRFGSTSAPQTVTLTPDMQFFGWTPAMVSKIESTMAQCHYGYRPDTMVNPTTGEVKLDAFIRPEPDKNDKQVMINGLAPDYKESPPFEGTCSHLAWQAWQHWARSPETKDLSFQPVTGTQADYFMSGQHTYLLAWPKRLQPVIEPMLSKLPLPLTTDQWLDQLPIGVAVIDPSFQRWTIKTADNPQWRPTLKAMGLSVAKWLTHESIDFRLPSAVVKWSLRNRLPFDPSAPPEQRPMSFRSCPLGYAAEWVPEFVPSEVGPTRPDDASILLLGVVDTKQDMTSTSGGLAIAGLSKPNAPFRLLSDLTSLSPSNPLRQVVNHINTRLWRPDGEHQQAYLDCLERVAAAPPAEDPLLAIIQKILGDKAPKDPRALAAIAAMLRESGVLDQGTKPPPK